MTDFSYVYILESIEQPGHFYTGYTKDLQKRLETHNQGRCQFTAFRRPWRIKNAIAFIDDQKALAFEKYLKSGSGRAFASRHF